MTIHIHIETGKLENTYDGHFYNDHVLEYQKFESTNPNSDMIEMEVSCRRCGDLEKARIHTEDDRRIWTIHAWLVGRFDEACDQPQRKIERAAREVINSHQGEPASESLLAEMREEIREKTDRPNAQIRFV